MLYKYEQALLYVCCLPLMAMEQTGRLVACVDCSGEVYLELLCGVDAAAEEGGGIWLHFSTLHGSWKDSVCQYSFHYFL